MLPLWQTPMIIAALQEQHIVANFVELATFPRARGGLRNAVVFVKQRDRSRAAAIIRLAGT